MSKKAKQQPEQDELIEEVTVEFIGGPLDGTRITDLAVVVLGRARVRVLDATYRAPERPLVASA